MALGLWEGGKKTNILRHPRELAVRARRLQLWWEPCSLGLGHAARRCNEEQGPLGSWSFVSDAEKAVGVI